MNRAINPQGIAQTQSCPFSPMTFVNTIWQAYDAYPHPNVAAAMATVGLVDEAVPHHTLVKKTKKKNTKKRAEKKNQQKRARPAPTKKKCIPKEEAAPLKSPPLQLLSPSLDTPLSPLLLPPPPPLLLPPPSPPLPNQTTGVRKTDEHCRIWKGRQRKGKGKGKEGKAGVAGRMPSTGQFGVGSSTRRGTWSGGSANTFVEPRSQSRHRIFYSDIPRKRSPRWVSAATDFNHINFCVSLFFFF